MTKVLHPPPLQSLPTIEAIPPITVTEVEGAINGIKSAQITRSEDNRAELCNTLLCVDNIFLASPNKANFKQFVWNDCSMIFDWIWMKLSFHQLIPLKQDCYMPKTEGFSYREKWRFTTVVFCHRRIGVCLIYEIYQELIAFTHAALNSCNSTPRTICQTSPLRHQRNRLIR